MVRRVIFTERLIEFFCQDYRASAYQGSTGLTAIDKRGLTWPGVDSRYENIIAMNHKTNEIIIIMMQMSFILAFPFLCFI